MAHNNNKTLDFENRFDLQEMFMILCPKTMVKTTECQVSFFRKYDEKPAESWRGIWDHRNHKFVYCSYDKIFLLQRKNIHSEEDVIRYAGQINDICDRTANDISNEYNNLIENVTEKLAKENISITFNNAKSIKVFTCISDKVTVSAKEINEMFSVSSYKEIKNNWKKNKEMFWEKVKVALDKKVNEFIKLLSIENMFGEENEEIINNCKECLNRGCGIYWDYEKGVYYKKLNTTCRSMKIVYPVGVASKMEDVVKAFSKESVVSKIIREYQDMNRKSKTIKIEF